MDGASNATSEALWPACVSSTPAQRIKQKAHSSEWAFWLYWEPGGVLLSHGECHTTIVAAAFHF